MNISEVKDLMAQFDQSSLREFSFKTDESELTFSKNEYTAPVAPVTTAAPVSAPVEVAAAQAPHLIHFVGSMECGCLTVPVIAPTGHLRAQAVQPQHCDLSVI